MVLEGVQRSWHVTSSTGWLTAPWVKDVVQGLGALHCALCPILSLRREPCLPILPRAQVDLSSGFPPRPQGAPNPPGLPPGPWAPRNSHRLSPALWCLGGDLLLCCLLCESFPPSLGRGLLPRSRWQGLVPQARTLGGVVGGASFPRPASCRPQSRHS